MTLTGSIKRTCAICSRPIGDGESRVGFFPTTADPRWAMTVHRTCRDAEYNKTQSSEDSAK